MSRQCFVCGASGLFAAILIYSLAIAQAQPPRIESAPLQSTPPLAENSLPPPPGSPRPANAEKPPSKEKDGTGIDALLDKLATIKAQKAELERAEKEMIALLKEKLKQQKQKLQKLGVEPEEATSPPPTSLVAPYTSS